MTVCDASISIQATYMVGFFVIPEIYVDQTTNLCFNNVWSEENRKVCEVTALTDHLCAAICRHTTPGVVPATKSGCRKEVRAKKSKVTD